MPAGAGVDICSVGEGGPGRLSPATGIDGPCLAALRPLHPVDSRCPPLLPAFLGVRVRLAIAGQAI